MAHGKAISYLTANYQISSWRHKQTKMLFIVPYMGSERSESSNLTHLPANLYQWLGSSNLLANKLPDFLSYQLWLSERVEARGSVDGAITPSIIGPKFKSPDVPDCEDVLGPEA